MRKISGERIVEMTRLGMSASQIAEIVGCSDRTVVRVRAREGIAGHCPPPLSAEKVSAAEEMLTDGCSIRETARTLGVSYESVHRRFPGRGWSKSQCAEYRTALRVFGKGIGL